MRAIKTTSISILTIGLLAGSAVGIAAQDEDAAAEPATPAKVTGTYQFRGDVVQEPTETVTDGLLEVRGFVQAGDALEMDDPRLTGTVSVALSMDVHKAGDFEDVVLQTFETRIDNDDGSWTGQGTSLIHAGGAVPEEETIDLATYQMTGAGAYEGLSAYLFTDFTEDPPSVYGVIYEGELPPFPELPEPEVEAAE